MSRYARQYEGDVLYRAVVVRPNGTISYHGPYDTAAKARRRLTEHVGNPPGPGYEDSRVEVARPEWTAVDQ
ncbi:hypothetical protein [Amycolatopsis taiwanensis]|uniref:hypothetical protein n=1 Tax=Amycolatopsis taiwanensis TaxID=342230 RepID=UPI000485CB0E|nr:hypothetical protein [Amycolatopsis taiwanensis]